MTRNSNNNFFYFKTPNIVVKKLYEHLDYETKNSILDIGAGKGTLILPHTHNNSIHKIAIEINENLKDELQSLYNDVLIGNLITSKIQDIVGSFPKDAIYVSNPPFGRVDSSSQIQQLLFSQGLFSNTRPVKTYRIELIFIARVLEVASIGDEAVFIIPISLLENSDFKLARKTLCREHNLHTCLILPEKTFKKTEVRTAIVWFRPHTNKTEQSIKIYRVDNHQELTIDPAIFVEQGISASNLICHNGAPLGSLILSIKRGKSTKRSLVSRNIEHIHTTDLNRQHAQVIYNYKKNLNVEIPSEKVARDGDILIARVGTRVLGKAAIFSGNETVISDCVVRLRVADSDRNSIFKQLVSERGQNWFKNVATGSCARVLTYNAINNFPLTV